MERKVEISVYLKTDPDPTQNQIDAMQAQILSWPEVKSSVFVSKQDALDRLRADFKDNPEILEGLTGNPLPASFEISLVTPQTVSAVAARFNGNPIVDQVKYGKEIADKLFNVTNRVRKYMYGFIALFGVVAVLLISNTIRLSIVARRRELEIMKLVGAGNWFIRWPFIIEGVIVGLAGAIVASVVVLLLNSYLLSKVGDSLTFMAASLDAVPNVTVALILLAVGVVIGALGSGIGLWRLLKV